MAATRTRPTGRKKGVQSVPREPLLPPGPVTAEHVRLVYDFALSGLKDVEIAERFGVATSTFYEWRKSNDAFRVALAEAKLIADAPLLAEIEKIARGDYRVSGEVITTKLEDGSKHVKYVKGGEPNANVLLNVLKLRHPQLVGKLTNAARESEGPNDESAVRAHETRLMEIAASYGRTN